jgi:hypothetical protein
MMSSIRPTGASHVNLTAGKPRKNGQADAKPQQYNGQVAGKKPEHDGEWTLGYQNFSPKKNDFPSNTTSTTPR